MEEIIIKENWNKTKGKLFQKYTELTEDDLEYHAGKEDELLDRLQKKTGKSREEVIRMIRDA